MTPENKPEQPPVIDYEGSTYQTTFWEQGNRAYEDQAEAVALGRLLPAGGDLILDVGAGAGRNAPRYRGFKRIVLMDYSRTQLQQAQERLGRSDRYVYVAADVYRLPFAAGLFDAAAMIRALHHMVDAPLALGQVRRALQPGAAFILEYANKRNLKAILRYLTRRQEWNPFTREPFEFAELNFDFHPAAVRAWLEEAGFSPGRTLTVSHFRLGFLKRTLPLKLLVGLDSLFQWTGSLWQFTPSVFVRSRAVGESPTAGPGEFFRCPSCGEGLAEDDPQKLVCGGCGCVWAIREGIYDFKEPVGEGGRETGRQVGREAGRQGDREGGKQGDRETGRQGDRETGRQGNR